MSRCLPLSVVSSLVMLLLAPCSFGQQARPADGDVGKKVYQRVLKSAVCILSVKGNKIAGIGSGSLIDAKRKWVLTNYHVVSESDKAIVLFPAFQKNTSGKPEVIAERDYYMKQFKERGIAAKVLEKKPDCDLALLELAAIPEGVLALPLARETASPGDRVHSVGNPGASGALWVYTSGTVRQVYRKKIRIPSSEGRAGFEVDARVVETQSPTNRGDSGGPLVNDRAELVAVAQSVAQGDARLVSNFIEAGEVHRLSKAKGLKFVVSAPASSPKPPVEATADKPPAGKPIDAAEKNEQLARSLLNFAKDLAAEGKLEKARERCEKIIKMYPETKAATEAKQLLEKLKK